MRKIAEMLAILRSDKEQKASQAQQQADSIRYLHELNNVSLMVFITINIYSFL